MSKIEPRNLKGFRDYAPKEQLARQAMFSKIQNVFERFGFLPLSTPVLEYKEILMNKYGDEERLVYSFKDNGDREVAMRYDLTVPLARFVAQNKGTLTFPFKRYHIAPVWRAENTQKGRLREFYQCDIDIVGTKNEFLGTADAEVIACYAEVLRSLGVGNFQIFLNDRFLIDDLAGTIEEKAQIPEVLRCMDKVDKIGIQEVLLLMDSRGIGSVLRDKVERLLGFGKGESFLDEYEKLNDASATRAKFYRLLIESIVSLGVSRDKIVFDPSIARGLDYYTSTVFEFKLTGVEGYGSIVGGGRYNDLLKTFSEDSLPAVGGALGVDRLYEYLEAEGKLSQENNLEVVMFNLGQSPWLQQQVLTVSTMLRDSGISVDLYYDNSKIEQQFKYAENKGAKYAILCGEEELAAGHAKVKNLATREQEDVELSSLIEYLNKH